MRLSNKDNQISDKNVQGTEYESGAQLLTRIRTERRLRWKQVELASCEAKGKQLPNAWMELVPVPAS